MARTAFRKPNYLTPCRVGVHFAKEPGHTPIRVLASVIQRDNRLLVCRRELSSLPLAPSDRRYLASQRYGGGKEGG